MNSGFKKFERELTNYATAATQFKYVITVMVLTALKRSLQATANLFSDNNFVSV